MDINQRFLVSQYCSSRSFIFDTPPERTHSWASSSFVLETSLERLYTRDSSSSILDCFLIITFSFVFSWMSKFPELSSTSFDPSESQTLCLTLSRQACRETSKCRGGLLGPPLCGGPRWPQTCNFWGSSLLVGKYEKWQWVCEEKKSKSPNYGPW